MRKFNFAKIISFVFICAVLVGALAIAAFATEETPTVEIAAHNVYYGDSFHIMYAVKAPAGATITAVDTEGENVKVVPFKDPKTGATTVTLNGVVYDMYITEAGVAAQALDEVITLTVKAGDEVATNAYSVLQYTYERKQDLADATSDADVKELAMLNALVEYADAANAFMAKEGETVVSFKTYKYVAVVGGNVATGMYAADTTPFANIEYTGEAYDSTTHHVEWVVVVGDAAAKTYDSEEIKTVKVTGDMTVTATVVENGGSSETPDEDDPVVDLGFSGRYYIAAIRTSGNYFYMTTDNKNNRYTAVDTGLTELPTSILGPDANKIFVLEKNEDGTYYIYAEGVDENNYLAWTSGNVGVFVAKDEAQALTVELTEKGYNIHFTASDAERYLALNGTAGNNYFVFYKSGQKQDLALIPVIDCDHEHTEEKAEIPANCTEIGYEAGIYCNDCGKYIEGGKVINAKGHSFGAWAETTPATCTAAGEETRECTVDGCDAKETQPTVKLDHFDSEDDADTICDTCDKDLGGGYVPPEPELLATFTFGANGTATHKDGSSDKATYSETNNGYTLSITGGSKMYPSSYDAKGNSCIKLGSSSAAGKFTFTVDDNITKVIIYVAGYKANTAKFIVNGGTPVTVSTQSNNGEYTAIEIDTSVTKTITISTASGGYRAMMDSIEFIGIAK